MSEVIYCDNDSMEILSKRRPRQKRFITKIRLPRLKGFEDKYFWLHISGHVYKWCGPFTNGTFEIGLTDLQFLLKDEYIYHEYVKYFKRLKEIKKYRVRMNDAIRDYQESVKNLSLGVDSLFDSVEIMKNEVRKMNMIFTLGTIVPIGNA